MYRQLQTTMGQYFKPTLFVENPKSNDKKVISIHSFEFGQGSKLMEHSYVGNSLVLGVKSVIAYYQDMGYKIILNWAGDYADPIEGEKDNIYTKYTDNVKVKGYEQCGYVKDFDTIVINDTDEIKFIKDYQQKRFLVNDTKKTYVDYEALVPQRIYWNYSYAQFIEPLAILCADGCGCSGSDYHGTNMEYVGTWKNDEIRFLDCKDAIPEDYVGVTPEFKEE